MVAFPKIDSLIFFLTLGGYLYINEVDLMVMKFNHKLIKMIVIILIVCLLSFALTSSSADALVTEVLLTGACAVNPAVALAVAGTILVGAGLTFDNQEKLEVMAAALINNNPVINNLIGGFECMAAASAEFFNFNLTQAAVDELGGWLDGVFTASSGAVGNVAVTTNDFYVNGQSINWCPVVTSYDWYALSDAEKTALVVNSGVSLTSAYYPLSQMIVNSEGQSLYHDAFVKNDYGYIYGGCVVSPSFFLYSSGGSIYGTFGSGSNHYSFDKVLCVTFYNSLDVATSFGFVGYSSVNGYRGWIGDNFDFAATTGFSTVSSSASADSTFFPQSLDNEKKLTPGIPLTVPESLTNLVDLPVDGVRNVSTDIPIDEPFSTVGDIAGEGTGTGIFEGIGNWILNIPILGTIARTISSIFELLQGFLAALINAFTGLLDGVVEGITNFFNGIPDVIRAIRDFLANIFNKLGDILAALVGFIGRILAFIPDIITFLLSYELFGSLISKFIPQPVAVVMIAFFLGTVCIWLFRWILNR